MESTVVKFISEALDSDFKSLKNEIKTLNEKNDKCK